MLQVDDSKSARIGTRKQDIIVFSYAARQVLV